MARDVSGINKPQPQAVQPNTGQRTPLMEIAERIKKLIHDHGEQFGDELKAKIDSNGDKMSVAKALQKWADDTLEPKEKEREPAGSIRANRSPTGRPGCVPSHVVGRAVSSELELRNLPTIRELSFGCPAA